MPQLYNALASEETPANGGALPLWHSLLSILATLRRDAALFWQLDIDSSLPGAAVAGMMKTAGPSALAAKAPTAVRRSRGLAAMTKVRGAC